MAEQVEMSSFDLRYEGYRMRSSGAEKALLLSILEKGIRDPLQGIDTKQSRILLDGFKRYRCANKLGIGIVPYCSLSSDGHYRTDSHVQCKQSQYPGAGQIN
jgi:hypothetical protein